LLIAQHYLNREKVENQKVAVLTKPS